MCPTPQLDEAERGFSFQADGPLDMRMDPTAGESAADWIARADADEIAHVLWVFGEERFSRRIAKAIVEARKLAPIDDYSAQSNCDQRTTKKDQNKHPATRSFQGIRLYINDELAEVEQGLEAAMNRLEVGGRLAVISFHSLEDRLVKRALRDASRPPKGDPRMPLPDSVAQPKLKLVGKAIKAGPEELTQFTSTKRGASESLNGRRQPDAVVPSVRCWLSILLAISVLVTSIYVIETAYQTRQIVLGVTGAPC